MNRRSFLRLLTGGAVIAGLGLTTLGCNHKSGRQLGPTSQTSADLIVDNRSQNTLHVYVDGGEIGEAPPGAEARFQILSGYRTVEVRERGHNHRHDFGELYFGFDQVEITYRP